MHVALLIQIAFLGTTFKFIFEDKPQRCLSGPDSICLTVCLWRVSVHSWDLLDLLKTKHLSLSRACGLKRLGDLRDLLETKHLSRARAHAQIQRRTRPERRQLQHQSRGTNWPG